MTEARAPGQPRWETPEPKGVTGSYGYAAMRWAKRELRITPAPWQRRVIVNALRHDAQGRLIHRAALISTARQNGKSVIVRIIVGWIMAEGRCLPAFAAWTSMLLAAHDAKQARIVYKAVYGDLAGIPELTQSPPRKHGDPLVRPVIKLTDWIGIEAPGLMLDTVTSQPGSARGTSNGLIAWDEMLTQVDWTMWEALSPTQSAQANPLMLLTSTAGYDSSIVLRAFYDRLVRQAEGKDKPDPTFYGAWWASDDPNAGLDWTQLAQANPAMGSGRPTRAAIRAEYAVLPATSWTRERLNHWVEVRVDAAFNPSVWAKLRTPDPLEGVEPPFYLGVDIQPGWERATITVAATRPDGRIGAEVYREFRAEEGLITADTLIAAIDAFPHPVSVVAYEGVSGAAGPFDRHGEGAWGVEWRALKPHMTVAACMDITQMILSGQIAVDDPLLDAQVQLVARRPVGQDGAFRFSRAHSGGPIDAFMALTFAVHAATTAVPLPKIT